MRREIEDAINLIIKILLVILAIVIVYQLIKIIVGGSWTTENIIISLLIFNLGAVFSIVIILSQLVTDHKNLTRRFNNLAYDLKKHLEESSKK